MAFYNTLITLLNNLGFFNVILPFLLVYAIMYGILSKYKILGDPFAEGDKGKTTRSLISIVSAATGFFIVASSNVVLSLKTFIPYVVLLLLAVFFLILAISPFLQKEEKSGEIQIGNRTRTILLASVIIIFTLMVIFILGLYNYINLSLTSKVISSLQTFIETIVVLAIMFGIAYWAVKPEKGQGSGPSRSR
jgi:ABC-type antimicrobial peptide transport system permease subunit